MANQTLDYVEQEVECADPVRLIELLYQRALRDLQNAHELWPEPEHAADAIQHVVHAQRILLELQRSLDHQVGGRFSQNLARLYEYMQFRLAEATSLPPQSAPARIAEIIELLGSLSAAWSTMAQERHNAPAVAVLAHDRMLMES
jgi:flagellar secretion chaperone FliS